MQLIDGQAVFSATDLVGFLYCEHLTNLDRAALAGLVTRPIRDDPEIDIIAKRGDRHEKRYLADLRAAGKQVTEIEKDGYGADHIASLREAAAETLTAIRRGDEVIYQATFFDGRWRGHADFLTRVPTPSDLGPWSYEVADTKLARSAKAGALLQMCVYSDLLTAVQRVQPEEMEVALGGSARAIERFRVNDYMAYYRSVKARFEAVVLASGPAAFPPVGTYPEPVEHCEVCKWAIDCKARRHVDRHLSLVAGISRKQRVALVKRDPPVDTVEELAELPLPVRPKLEGTTDPATTRVREQARLQAEGRRLDRVLFELLDPIEAGKGLALLPPPSKGDLFFDIEGDPFVEEGGSDGLEYLFGVIEPGDGLGLDPVFHDLWGLDRAGEKQAFERFLDLVMARLEKDPNLHIYHYAAYEPTAVKKLMGRHATREEEVDRLLRGGVFVDLFSVVRQGVRVSQESYSIKKMEPLYHLERTVPLRDAGSSILNFELWLDSDGTKQELLDLIREYNRDDCVSNWKLRDWLEEQRASVIAKGVEVPRPGPRIGDAPAPVTEIQARVDALVARLTGSVPIDPDDRTADQQATWLLAQLLDWHRREDKSTWWEYFHRLNELTDEDRLDDDACIAGLVFDGPGEIARGRQVYRYRFEPQENDVGPRSSLTDPATGESAGTFVSIDQIAGTLEVRRAVGSEVPHPTSIVPLDFIPSDQQREALLRLATWVADNGIDAPGRFRASRDLLLRRAPRIGQTDGERLAHEGESGLDAALRLILRLDESCLAIQGPPGTGKTFTGARMIVELVRAGKRVGITATSHKVIGLLLDGVCAAAEQLGVEVTAMQRADDEDRCSATIVRRAANNAELRDALRPGDVMIGAGTSWVWSREEFAETVDVLFIDEAGQISLTNVLAVAQTAKSIVLLGDPRQLEQPLKGSHPPGADRSALEHLLGEHRTMPEDRGLFLEKTWRLHPDLCAFTSEVFYESRLESEAGTLSQALTGSSELSGTGLRWVKVDHVGNTNVSVEEAEAVATLARSLIGTPWTDRDGRTRPIGWRDILVVAPFNKQRAAIAELIPEAAVGTVDKFQGQQAAVAFYSMTTSSPELAPRGMEFLYSLNRLNVATSRAFCLAVIVASPALLKVQAHSPKQMRLANALCRAAEFARVEGRVNDKEYGPADPSQAEARG